jgi:hypothetical protein
LFLFDFGNLLTKYSECFDESKLLSEQKKILPCLFTKKEDDKPSIFEPFVERILDYIHDCTRKDKAFSEAYQKEIQKVRKNASYEERAVYYAQLFLQILPKSTNETGKKSPTAEVINSFNDLPYSKRLVEELEDLPPEPDFFFLSLPFLVCGPEIYSSITKALRFLVFRSLSDSKFSVDFIEQLDIPGWYIPRWNEKDYIHHVFFHFAFALSTDSKDMSALILNKVLEGVNPKDIPYIFFEYIQSNYHSIYGALLKQNYFELIKDGYIDLIKPFRNELEYLDGILTADIRTLHKSIFEKCRLFLDYLKRLALSAQEDKLALFQELSFLKPRRGQYFQPNWFLQFRDKTIKDVLDSVARESVHGEQPSPDLQKEAVALHKEFIDTIAKGAAAYPVKSFLADEYRHNFAPVEPKEQELTILKRYCEIVELNPEDALFLAQYSFEEFHYHNISYRSSEAFSEFIKNEEFFCKNVFYRFIDNDDFVRIFWSIPQKTRQNSHSQAAQFWVIYYLAVWINRNNSHAENVLDAASQELERGEAVFSKKMSEFISLNEIFDELLKGETYFVLNEKIKLFLCNLFAALGGIRFDSMLKNMHTAKEHFPFYVIRYNYSHEKIVPKELLEFLFKLKNPSRCNTDSFDKNYPFELIKEACNYKEIKGDAFIEAKTNFFLQFYEKAVQESDGSYMELSIFLRFRLYFHDEVDSILNEQTGSTDILIVRCSKMLNVYKSFVGRNEFPVEENTFYYDYVLPASDFIYEKTENIWKVIKPLLLAFRASKRKMLNESLSGFSPLLQRIFSFFMIDDKESLKELRYAMANDFAEYLKEAKKERPKENFTEREINEPGFNLFYTEPSPFWRYAYIRALADLRVKTDGRGHFYHNLLAKVSAEDPSEAVKTAAEKVIKELDSIRNGYSGNNHKKCLFEAFWWLRQAHMLSLGEKVDKKKANELRIKEWR